jgi:hypothetical protein
MKQRLNLISSFFQKKIGRGLDMTSETEIWREIQKVKKMEMMEM